MPLLTSPIDGSPMRQIQRFGIELDVCPTSGGVWLDKGELEKLMAFIKQAAEEEARTQVSRPQREQRYEESYDDEDEYRMSSHRERSDHHQQGRHKKKGALHQMMELFEF